MSSSEIVLLAFFSLAAAAILLSLFRRRRNVRKSFAAVASHFGGRFEPGETPRAVFFHEQRPATLRLGKRPLLGRRPLVLSLAWPDEFLVLAVAPRRRSRAMDRLFSRTALSSGNGRFDRLYQARGAPREKAEILLSAAVQTCIDQLRYLYDTNDVELNIGGGEFLVTKRGLSRMPSSIIRFVELATELYDQAMLLHTSGLTFLAGSDADACRDARCRVCGEGFDGPVVLCRECGAPHHKDCWRYLGRCTVYGCSGRKFRRSVIAPAGKRR